MDKDSGPFLFHERWVCILYNGELHSYSDKIRLGDGVSNTVWESNLAGIEALAERR